MSILQPIKLPVKVYTSTDAGAPQLTKSTTPGQLKSVLKACLVTGYGAGADHKEPMGWELLFEDGNKGVFRSTDARSTQNCLRINPISSSSNGDKVDCYKSMSDIDTGADRWLSSYSTGICRTDAVSSAKWWVYATAATVLVVYNCYSYKGSVASAHFMFGDVLSLKDSDTDNCIVSANNCVSNSVYVRYYAFLANDGYSIVTTPAGEISATKKTLGFSRTTNNATIPGGLLHPIYLPVGGDFRLILPFLGHEKRDATRPDGEVITVGGRQFHSQPLGLKGECYYIPVDYWEI